MHRNMPTQSQRRYQWLAIFSALWNCTHENIKRHVRSCELISIRDQLRSIAYVNIRRSLQPYLTYTICRGRYFWQLFPRRRLWLQSSNISKKHVKNMPLSRFLLGFHFDCSIALFVIHRFAPAYAFTRAPDKIKCKAKHPHSCKYLLHWLIQLIEAIAQIQNGKKVICGQGRQNALLHVARKKDEELPPYLVLAEWLIHSAGGQHQQQKAYRAKYQPKHNAFTLVNVVDGDAMGTHLGTNW